MSASDNPPRTDIGRLVGISVFSFLMIMNFLHINGESKMLLPIDATKALQLIHSLLVTSFYLFIIALYFPRNPAKATTGSLTVKFIAVFSSFIPFIIPLLAGSACTGSVALTSSTLVLLMGMRFILATPGTLGKTFSIIPQARRLVVRGPYRMVRHPLYLGEIIGVLGLILAGFSALKLFIFLLLVACQVYRAGEEEKLLSVAFQEYAGYASKTARFIPRVF